jgi:putative MFS transporter
MCFMMGAAAGGMLPVTYALLAEMMPSRHRGWSLVLVGGLGAAGGYLAASGLSALLQPIFGWRILWLANLPTGLALVGLGAFIPESARFLIARDRVAEAEKVMRRFGARVRTAPVESPSDPAADKRGDRRGFGVGLAGLSIAALTWGMVNFGILLWLPGDLAAKGFSIGAASGLLAQSSLIAFPAVFIAALLYSRWSTKGSLVVMILVLVIGLAGVFRLEVAGSGDIVLPVALLIVGSNGLLAVLLPYASESAPLRIRGRAIGWVAACTKGGGLIAQTLSILALVPAMSVVTACVVAPAAIALAMIACFGRETRSIDLRLLDAPTVMACWATGLADPWQAPRQTSLVTSTGVEPPYPLTAASPRTRPVAYTGIGLTPDGGMNWFLPPCRPAPRPGDDPDQSACRRRRDRAAWPEHAGR